MFLIGSLDIGGNTALHLAAFNKHPKVIKNISNKIQYFHKVTKLDEGADPKAKTSVGLTPLRLVISIISYVLFDKLFQKRT